MYLFMIYLIIQSSAQTVLASNGNLVSKNLM